VIPGHAELLSAGPCLRPEPSAAALRGQLSPSGLQGLPACLCGCLLGRPRRCCGPDATGHWPLHPAKCGSLRHSPEAQLMGARLLFGQQK